MTDRGAQVARLFAAFTSGKSPERAEIYVGAVEWVDLETLESAVGGILNTWTTQSVPPLGVLLGKCRDLVSERQRTLADRGVVALDQGRRPLGRLEVETCSLVKQLGRRGVYWNPRQRAFGLELPDAEDFRLADERWNPTHAEVADAWDLYAARALRKVSAYSAPVDDVIPF